MVIIKTEIIYGENHANEVTEEVRKKSSQTLTPSLPRGLPLTSKTVWRQRGHAPLVRFNRIGRENNRINNRNHGPSPENNRGG